MYSVERIQEFVAVEQEAMQATSKTALPEDWPVGGTLQFANYSTRYRPDLEPVLKNINLKIGSREKVGVVGRTGAGKSSLALAILRALEAESGSISIDGVNIASIGLDDLRQAVTVVPQDPTLFSGTLRFNLDPFGLFSDFDLLKALQDVQLITSSATETSNISESASVSNGATGEDPAVAAGAFFRNLSSMLTDSGTNISQGQRQLVCLARAILRCSKIIILDEATASIDYSTDLKLQKVMDSIDATKITIAHRLNTIINFDKILVLDHGEVMEFDHPWKLLQDEKGLFRDICKASGNMEVLEKMAMETWQRSSSS